MNKAGSNTYTVWRTTNLRSVQKLTFHKIILDIISHRRPKTSSRNSKENID